MPIAVAGLQTHIWNNNAKSMMLLALYPLLIIGMIWLLSFASGYIYYGGNIHSYDGIMNGQTPWGHQDTTLQSPTAAVNLANYIVINNLWLILRLFSAGLPFPGFFTQK